MIDLLALAPDPGDALTLLITQDDQCPKDCAVKQLPTGAVQIGIAAQDTRFSATGTVSLRLTRNDVVVTNLSRPSIAVYGGADADPQLTLRGSITTNQVVTCLADDDLIEIGHERKAGVYQPLIHLYLDPAVLRRVSTQ
jgi:hypothetical protein